MDRQAGACIYSYIIPSITLVAFSYAGFWIDPNIAPARVALGIVSVLTVVGLRQQVFLTMPKVTYPVWLTTFMFGCFCFNAYSIFDFAVCHYGLHVRKQLKTEQDKADA